MKINKQGYVFLPSGRDYLLSLSAVSITIALCMPASMVIGYRSVSLILLCTVLLLSTVFCFGSVMLASIVSAAVWNFFFLPPRYAFRINELEDFLACCMFLIVAFVTGSMASKIRKHAESVQKAMLLSESDKLYKTLFNSISHELRIPVATIMGAADALLTNSYPENVKKELYGEILTASNRLNRLIENLLNMSRLGSGKIAPHIDWCDINDLFNSVADNLKEHLKPFRLDILISEGMPLVKLDTGLMEQVLHNLVYNSCKYAYPGTIIRMKASYDNGYLIIQEMDNGPGFPPDVLTSVFDKFYKNRNRNQGGLGLGLSIVKGFVEAHKGDISVENRLNGGTLFTIKIPTEISYANNLITEQHEQS
jgi:two-component system sensor histidine kinase KdpD